MTLHKLRNDIELHPSYNDQHGAPTWILFDPARNAFFRIGWLEFECLSRWDTQNPDAIADDITKNTTLKPSRADILQLNNFLKANNLIIPQGAEDISILKDNHVKAQKAGARNFLHAYIFYRIPLFKPDKFLDVITPKLGFFFTSAALRIFIGLCVLCLALLLRDWHSFSNSFIYFFTAEGLAISAITLFSLQIFHELGHAVTAKHYGLKVPTIGLGFIVLLPIMYTDATDGWRLSSHKDRLWISASGVITEIGIAILATLFWFFLDDGLIRSILFIIASTSWIMTLVINLNPFMRFDGYYLLSDILRIENLQSRAFAYAKWFMRKTVFGFTSAPPEPVTRKQGLLYIAYSYLTWLYRFVVFLSLALMVYHLFFKALGVVLMVIEIAYFILIPILKEIKVWWHLKGQMRFNLDLIFTLTILGLIGLACAYPWQSRIEAPAVLTAAQVHHIYPAEDGRLTHILIKETDSVKEGDALFKLSAPQILQDLAIAEESLEQAALTLNRTGTVQSWREQTQIAQEQYNAAAERIKNIQGEIEKLDIKAPFSGFVSYLAPEIQDGQWVGAGTHIATISTNNAPVIYAYVKAYQLGRLQQGAAATFISALDLKPLKAVITHIDLTAPENLEDKELSSVYGGDIATRLDQKNGYVPHEAIYKLSLQPLEKNLSLQQRQKGWVKIEAEKHSLIDRIYKKAAAVFIREMNF